MELAYQVERRRFWGKPHQPRSTKAGQRNRIEQQCVATRAHPAAQTSCSSRAIKDSAGAPLRSFQPLPGRKAQADARPRFDDGFGEGSRRAAAGRGVPLPGGSTPRRVAPDRGGRRPPAEWGFSSAPFGGHVLGEAVRRGAKPLGDAGRERRRRGRSAKRGGAGGGVAPKRRSALPRRWTTYPHSPVLVRRVKESYAKTGALQVIDLQKKNVVSLASLVCKNTKIGV